MKKLKYLVAILVALIMITGPMIQSAAAKKVIVIIRVEIEWGRKNRDCRGLGICGFRIEIDEVSLERIGYIPDSDEIQISISKQTFALNEDQFQDEVLRMEEDFELSDEIVEKLEIGRKATLPAGKYKGEWVDDSFIVKVPLK